MITTLDKNNCCSICDRHIYSLILWSPEIPSISDDGTIASELNEVINKGSGEYGESLSFIDPFNPTIIGSFTQWLP